MKNKTSRAIREQIAFDKAVEIDEQIAFDRAVIKKWKESIYSNYLRFCADNPNFPTYDKKLTFAEFDSGEFGKWADLQESLDNCGYRG